MDLSFQEKKNFANMLNGLQVTTIFVILENSGVFIETPCTLLKYLYVSEVSFSIINTNLVQKSQKNIGFSDIKFWTDRQTNRRTNTQTLSLIELLPIKKAVKRNVQ